MAFLQTTLEQHAQAESLSNLARDCLDRLALQKQLPETMLRRLPPSSQEICAVVTGGQMQQLVYFTDARQKTIDIDSLTTVQDLIDQLGEAKRFKGWALFEVLVAAELYMENPLKHDEMVCDVLSRWEKFQPPAKYVLCCHACVTCHMSHVTSISICTRLTHCLSHEGARASWCSSSCGRSTSS